MRYDLLSVSRCASRSPRRGLTLIELVVVLTILIALAGILIPLLPSMLTRGHTASIATNCGEINKAIQTHYQLYGGYPDQYDALTDGSNLIDYLAGSAAGLAPNPSAATGSTGVHDQIGMGSLTADELLAVQGAGITRVCRMQSKYASATSDWTPTFNPYLPGEPLNGTKIDTSTKLAFLSGTNAQEAIQLFNLSPTGKYLVLGIGPRCTMVGKSIAEAPLVFGDNQNLNPEFGYERFVAIYLVSDPGNPNATPPVPARTISQATLAVVASPHDIGLGGANDHIQNWYDLGKGSN